MIRILFLGLLACAGLALGILRGHAAGKSEPPTCRDAAPLKAAIQARHGKWTLVTSSQFNFLRGIYAVRPDTPAGLPPGDMAALAQIEGDNDGEVFFLKRDEVCSAMSAPSALIDMLKEVETTSDGVPL